MFGSVMIKLTLCAGLFNGPTGHGSLVPQYFEPKMPGSTIALAATAVRRYIATGIQLY